MFDYSRLYRMIWIVVVGLLLGSTSYAQEAGLVADWSFSPSQSMTAHGLKCSESKVEGTYKYVPGVVGKALRFDGYTTNVVCPASNAPKLGKSFTVEAWVALNTYPWNWVPVVDQEKEWQEGFFFGIDAFGHIGLQASVDGQWRKLVSKEKLSLKKWAHITGTYETDGNQGLMKIYLDGKQVGQLAVRGQLTIARRTDILIGRVRQATLPFPEAAIHPYYPVKYSLDGILDQVKIYDRSLSEEGIASSYAAVKVPSGDVLPWQKMPSGPPGEGHFGAYYATLHYQDTWDRLRRIGPDSDVVVRFDETPNRLVFWQGLNYIPAWVTDNDKWYSEQFIESWGKPGCPDGEDCEPMSDKQSRYSHVKILESNDARTVIDWRYAQNEVEHYKIAWPDPYTGWGEWTDEYWTVYPDGIAVRKQVLWSPKPAEDEEWQETIVLNQPGSRPEDDINWNALTLENMRGETKTYAWKPKPAGSFRRPDGPQKASGPPDANIQIVNIKSDWKPFEIVPPDGAHVNIYAGENTYFNFECWNHWPVAQIASSGRPCVADDRASHSSLSDIYWKPYSSHGLVKTEIMMDGLTKKSPAELVTLAKSWLSPAKMQLAGEGYKSDGYDPTQRAYIVKRTGEGAPAQLKLTLAGSAASPIYDPAFVIRDWGRGGARLEIDGQRVQWGRNYRVGHNCRLGGCDLVVWIQKESIKPLEVELVAGPE